MSVAVEYIHRKVREAKRGLEAKRLLQRARKKRERRVYQEEYQKAKLEETRRKARKKAKEDVNRPSLISRLLTPEKKARKRGAGRKISSHLEKMAETNPFGFNLLGVQQPRKKKRRKTKRRK